MSAIQETRKIRNDRVKEHKIWENHCELALELTFSVVVANSRRPPCANNKSKRPEKEEFKQGFVRNFQ